jgi:protease-4
VVEIKGEIAPAPMPAPNSWWPPCARPSRTPARKGVVLLINSPGGSPVQAGIINDEIRRLKGKYNKPVYAVVEESCASAAYYIAGRPTRSSSTRPASSAASAC